MRAVWSKWHRLAPHPLRHSAAFVICGLVAFSCDALVLKLLVALAHWHPIVARLAAIAVAMVVGWLCHRTFTFALTTPPTLREFLRYVTVGWLVAAINYTSFAALMLARPAMEPLVALVAASALAMVFAYLGMRFAAFRAPPRRRGEGA